MKIKIFTVKDCIENNDIINFINDSFNIPSHNIVKQIKRYLKDLREEITIVAETDYIDKVYRDSYYCYYSTKLKSYNRNCIKFSLFDVNPGLIDFDSVEGLDRLKQNYLGFIVIRPIEQSFGRNVISPRALKSANVKICAAKIQSTAAGMKLNILGFPHSSQDSETMTCAETTIWSLMEYFGNKYPDYRPILPSKILKILENRSYVRQIPSKGLIYQDISYALKEQGFGTVVYAKKNYREEQFRSIFSCYIESGYPLVVAIQGDRIGHAVLCIGYDYESANLRITGKKEKYWNWNECIEEFVFIDDNCAPYKIAKFSIPTKHYHKIEWDSCQITYFIVPLYNKIYLEAEQAITITTYLGEKFLNIDRDCVVKTFLASSRTYRDYVVNNMEIDRIIKDKILGENLPKFVWITELSTIDEFQNNKVNGLIMIDTTATGKNSKPLIFAYYNNNAFYFSQEEDKIKSIELKLALSYKAFNSNLVTIN